MGLARPKRSLPVRIEYWLHGDSTVIGYAEVTTSADATLKLWSERLAEGGRSGALVAIDQSTDAILALCPLAVPLSDTLPANDGEAAGSSGGPIAGKSPAPRGRFGRRFGVWKQDRPAANQLL